jgi:hypothetical protein
MLPKLRQNKGDKTMGIVITILAIIGVVAVVLWLLRRAWRTLKGLGVLDWRAIASLELFEVPRRLLEAPLRVKTTIRAAKRHLCRSAHDRSSPTCPERPSAKEGRTMGVRYVVSCSCASYPRASTETGLWYFELLEPEGTTSRPRSRDPKKPVHRLSKTGA